VNYGWKALVDDFYNDPLLGIDFLQYCARSLSSYKYLSDEDLDILLNRTALDPFTYSILNDISEYRKNLPDIITNTDPNLLTVALDQHGVEYRNIEKLNEHVVTAFHHFPDLKEWAINRHKDWLIHENGWWIDDPFEDLNDDETVGLLFVAYKMDVVRKYLERLAAINGPQSIDVNEDGMPKIWSDIYPSQKSLQEITQRAVLENSGVYAEIAILTARIEGTFYSLENHQAVSVFPTLDRIAQERFPDNKELQLIYILNSKVVSLAKGVYMVSSPDGEFVDVVTVDEFEAQEYCNSDLPLNTALHLLALAFKDDKLTVEGISAALYGNWKYFPTKIQEQARALGFHPYDGQGKLTDSRMLMDTAAKAGVAAKMTSELAWEIIDYLEDNIRKNFVMLDPFGFGSLHDVVEQFTSGVQSQILRHVDLERLIKVLSPSLVMNLERRLGVSFRELTSLREFLALCSYLTQIESSKHVKPFDTIDQIITGAQNQRDKINRLKAFLMNAFDKDAIENFTIFATVTEPEPVNRAFNAYAEAINSAHRFKLNVANSLLDTQKSDNLVHLIEHFDIGLIRRAGHLFYAGKQMALWEYSAEETVDDLVNGFEGVEKVCSLLASLNSEGQFEMLSREAIKGGDPSMRIFKFNLKDPETGYTYSLKASIRPVATTQDEARINFEVSLNDLPKDNDLYKAFNQTTNFKGVNGKNARTVTGSVIRFGFDLDTSTNPPAFSFDMGRDQHDSTELSRTGDVLGRILSQVAPTGHHLQDFDASLSNPSNFEQIARAFTAYFDSICSNEDGEPQYHLF
jgi:hypothetical protein